VRPVVCRYGESDQNGTGAYQLFFEAMVLQAFVSALSLLRARYAAPFNSYYECSARARARLRACLTRPRTASSALTVARSTRPVASLIGRGARPPRRPSCLSSDEPRAAASGIDADRHQHAFYLNLWKPAYPPFGAAAPARRPLGGTIIRGRPNGGHAGAGFASTTRAAPRGLAQAFQFFPRDRELRRYLDFVVDADYRRGELWLSDGWTPVGPGLGSALYWGANGNGRFNVYTFSGLQPLNRRGGVPPALRGCGVRNWAQARLPTEFGMGGGRSHGPARWHARPDRTYPEEADVATGRPEPMCDRVPWDPLSYTPTRAPAGCRSASEYNGKFMVGQLVLAAGSFATPPGHHSDHLPPLLPARRPVQFSGLDSRGRMRGRRLNRREADPDEPGLARCCHEFAGDAAGAQRPAAHHCAQSSLCTGGVSLFERICQLGRVLLTRAEMAALREHATEHRPAIGPRADLVESAPAAR